MAAAKFKVNEPAYKTFRVAIATGIVNVVGAIDGTAKSLTPVHGDPARGGEFSSFAPGEKPIGGTLARSIHHVVYIDGRRQFGGGSDDNGDAIPKYSTGRGIEGFVGTNIFYAVFVHDGTVKMKARPFLATAFQREMNNIAGYFSAGFQAVIGRGS